MVTAQASVRGICHLVAVPNFLYSFSNA